jgi:hypothetical protein
MQADQDYLASGHCWVVASQKVFEGSCSFVICVSFLGADVLVCRALSVRATRSVLDLAGHRPEE